MLKRFVNPMKDVNHRAGVIELDPYRGLFSLYINPTPVPLQPYIHQPLIFLINPRIARGLLSQA